MAEKSFFVEPTDYGWSVRVGSKRLGLFMTQRQALGDVKQRRDNLKAKGRLSTLTIAGSELEHSDSRLPRRSWRRR